MIRLRLPRLRRKPRRPWPRGAREAAIAAITALVVLAVLQFAGGAAFRALETASLDLRFRLRGVRPPGPEIALIRIDDPSVAVLGRWPFTRHLFAQALGILGRDGAKLVVFDLLFAEAEATVPSDLRADARSAAAALPGTAGAKLRSALQRLAEDDPDAEFTAAIRSAGNVLLPVAFAFSGKPGDEPDYLANSAYARFDNSPMPPVFPLQPVSALLPLPMLARAAIGLGHVNIAYDSDGSPRYDYLAIPYQGDFIPSLPVRVAAAYLGIPWPQVGLALGAGVELGPIAIPTDRAMRLLINYRGPPRTFPTYSFLDLLQGRVPEAALRGRIVLVGASLTGLADSNPEPFGVTQLPGTERMANIIDTILNRDFIRETPYPWGLVVFVAVPLLAALMGVATALLPTRAAIFSGAATMVVWFAAAQNAFGHGLWLPLASPLTALAAAILTVLLFRYRIVDREGRAIKSAFRHYLAPEMVNVLAAHPDQLKLGGETRPMTLLFCDVRGFTSISEQFKSNPQGLTRLINRFLTPMTDLIMARRGTIDKYMGDCIMAFWNAPLDDPAHADHACESALAMIRELDRVNLQLQVDAEAERRPTYPLRIGIGLNTGDCVVGNMGSDQRFDYSVLGDAVNLASRLESQSKTYHVSIIIGEATRAAALSWAAIELDLIAVQGKKEAVRIYTLLGDAAFAGSPAFKALAADHAAMLAAYRQQNWAKARTDLAQCRRHDAKLHDFYDLYEQRIAHYEANPPAPDWDGVFVATSK